MIQFDLFILEIFLVISTSILIFAYSLISSDFLNTMICCSIYLILLIPLLLIFENFRLFILELQIYLEIYNIIYYTCFSIYIFIGLILLIQLVYLIFFS